MSFSQSFCLLFLDVVCHQLPSADPPCKTLGLFLPIAVSRPPAIFTIIAGRPCIVGISEVVDGKSQRRDKLLVKPSPTSTAPSLIPAEAPVPSLTPLHQGEGVRSS